VKKAYLAFGLLLLIVLAALVSMPVKVPRIQPAPPSQGPAEAVTELLDSIGRMPGFVPSDVPPEIVQRPLFFKERRPPEEGAAPLTDAPAPRSGKAGAPPKVELKAVVGVGKELFALVTLKGKKDIQRLEPGAEIEGWRVEEIHQDRLVLGSGSERKEVLLRSYKPYVPKGGRVKPSRKPAGRRQASRSQSVTGKRAVVAKQGVRPRKP